MEYLRKPYYIGVLSAAELHGISPQSPQLLQIVTSEPIREVNRGRAPICFIANKNWKNAVIETMKTPTGYVKVSTAETTVIDSFFYKNHAGGLNGAVNILLEFAKAGKIDSKKLLKAAQGTHNMATAQRAGFVLDRYGFPQIARPLKNWIQKQEISLTPFDAESTRSKGFRDKVWQIYVNSDIRERPLT